MAQVARRLFLVREIWVSNLEPIKSPTCCQQLATAAALMCEPMKGEQFKINLQENATSCCVTKAQKIPIAYEKALRDELDDLLRGHNITRNTTD